MAPVTFYNLLCCVIHLFDSNPFLEFDNMLSFCSQRISKLQAQILSVLIQHFLSHLLLFRIKRIWRILFSNFGRETKFVFFNGRFTHMVYYPFSTSREQNSTLNFKVHSCLADPCQKNEKNNMGSLNHQQKLAIPGCSFLLTRLILFSLQICNQAFPKDICHSTISRLIRINPSR